MTANTIERLRVMQAQGVKGCAALGPLCDALIQTQASLTPNDEHDVLNCVGALLSLLPEVA